MDSKLPSFYAFSHNASILFSIWRIFREFSTFFEFLEFPEIFAKFMNSQNFRYRRRSMSTVGIQWRTQFYHQLRVLIKYLVPWMCDNLVDGSKRIFVSPVQPYVHICIWTAPKWGREGEYIFLCDIKYATKIYEKSWNTGISWKSKKWTESLKHNFNFKLNFIHCEVGEHFFTTCFVIFLGVPVFCRMYQCVFFKWGLLLGSVKVHKSVGKVCWTNLV